MASPLTDQYVSQLATPFTGTDTRNLIAGGADKIPIGNGIHVEMIALLFVIFILILFITVILGIIYSKYYQDKHNPYKGLTSEEKKALGDEFIYTDYQYVSVAGGVAGVVGLFFIFAFLGRWIGFYDKTLIVSNSIAEDIAVAMRVKQANKNVAGLLAASVHPLDNAESKAAREELRDHLNTAVKNSFKYETNAEKSKLTADVPAGAPAVEPPGWFSRKFRQQYQL